jgi:mRNA interferase RelE/StbE
LPCYAVSFRRSAEKDLCSLDATVQRRVLRAIDALARDPRPDGCRKLVEATTPSKSASEITG